MRSRKAIEATKTTTHKPTSLYTVDYKTGRLKVTTHWGQTRVWDSTARFVFMMAGTQSGKTSFGPLWLWREIQLAGGGDHLAVTASYDLFKLKMLPEMLKLYVNVLKVGKLWAGDGIIEICDLDERAKTGKKVFWAERSSDPMYGRIILRSAKAGGGLESATAISCWGDECGQDNFTVDTWEAIRRRLSLHQGRFLGTTTLYNMGWIKQQVYDPWKEGDKQFDVVQFDSSENPSFPIEEYREAQRTMEEWKFNLFYRGRFSRPPGMIYGSYDETFHLVEPFDIPAWWPVYVGVDPGGVNLATVWLAQNPENKSYYLFQETLEGDMSTTGHVEAALGRARGKNVIMWTGGAPGEDQVRRDWGSAGIGLIRPPVKDVEQGIDRVIKLFKSYRLFVFKTDETKGIRDELGTYSRVLGTDGEPMDRIKNKERFHRLDALRYACTFLDVPTSLSDVTPSKNDTPEPVNMFGGNTSPGQGLRNSAKTSSMFK